MIRRRPLGARRPPRSGAGDGGRLGQGGATARVQGRGVQAAVARPALCGLVMHNVPGLSGVCDVCGVFSTPSLKNENNQRTGRLAEKRGFESVGGT